MSIFTRGEQAKEQANQSNVDVKDIYLRLKSGEGHKVRVLGIYDYVSYKAHSSFNNKIYTQPCVSMLGKECALCKANKLGGEQFKDLYAKDRYVFVFASLEAKELRAIDISKQQAKKLIGDIEEYAENINEVAFTLRKTGEKTNTAYGLQPMLKMTGYEQAFEEVGKLEVTDEFFTAILKPRSLELQVKTLKEAGFDVVTHFPHVTINEDTQQAEATEGDDFLATI